MLHSSQILFKISIYVCCKNSVSDCIFNAFFFGANDTTKRVKKSGNKHWKTGNKSECQSKDVDKCKQSETQKLKVEVLSCGKAGHFTRECKAQKKTLVTQTVTRTQHNTHVCTRHQKVSMRVKRESTSGAWTADCMTHISNGKEDF